VDSFNDGGGCSIGPLAEGTIKPNSAHNDGSEKHVGLQFLKTKPKKQAGACFSGLLANCKKRR
jgi:hypothetical protein